MSNKNWNFEEGDILVDTEGSKYLVYCFKKIGRLPEFNLIYLGGNSFNNFFVKNVISVESLLGEFEISEIIPRAKILQILNNL